MGKIISQVEYRDNSIEVEAIQKFKQKPSHKGDLNKLLGFIGYYHASIRDFTKKPKPLYNSLSTPVTTKSKKKTFQKHQKVKNYPVNRLIGQTNTKVL